MTLSRIRLGDYIQFIDVRNKDNHIKNVMGVSVQKIFREPTSKVDKDELSKYKIVNPGQFSSVPTTHNEKCFAFAYNDSQKPIVVSSVNYVFEIIDETVILPRWLQLFFMRYEFDRYARFNSWGTAREVFGEEEIKNVIIDLPPLPIQQKYVDIFLAMIANQQSYERGLEDLKLVCDSTVESFKKIYPIKSFGKYIKRIDERNSNNQYRNVKNVSVTKDFSNVSSKVNKNELSDYKLVYPRQISFVQTTHNEHVFCNAMNNTDEVILVTSVNEVFECDENYIIPEYLCINFNRSEFDRYARFNSWGSARETFTWSDLQEVKIPIPPVEVQKALADMFVVYRKRKQINQQLKKQIRDICPFLIKGSIEEACSEE